MEMDVTGADRVAADEIPLWRLWFGVFGAPFAWAFQLIVAYAIVAHACFPDGAPMAHPVVSGARTIALVVSIICLATAVAAFLVARRSLAWARGATASAARDAESTRLGRTRFMAMAGTIVSVLFTFAVVMAALPLITRPTCG